MWIECFHCGADGDVGPPETIGFGLLACPDCGMPVERIEVSDWSDWIEQQVRSHSSLASRKNAPQSDEAISRDGMASEVAACLLLCPSQLGNWIESQKYSGNNRGNDFPETLTGLDLPVEVKTTRYKTNKTGFMLVRPPRMTRGEMKKEYIDAAIYVMLHQTGRYDFDWLGWCDRNHLIQHGIKNPVPIKGAQRQCWGVHWSKLIEPIGLASRLTDE